MFKKNILNFTLYQIIQNYGHIDGFTKDLSPRLNFFLLGSYYNLNIFQIFYSISFLRNFSFIYTNITVKGLPSLVVSTINFWKKGQNFNFLQYYSFGKWTFGLFSNWIYCKNFLNVSKYPFLNRKIRTIPKIIIGLNNNFFIEKELKNSYKSMLSFTFINSNYFDLKRYYAPLNVDSPISVKYYLKIFYNLYEKASLLKLMFFWSFNFLQKITKKRNFNIKLFLNILKKKKFMTFKGNNRRFKGKRNKKKPFFFKKDPKVDTRFYTDGLFNSFRNRILMSSLVTHSRLTAKNRFSLLSKHSWLFFRDSEKKSFFKKKKIKFQKIIKKKIKYKKKLKNFSANFLFNYFLCLLTLLKKEKTIDLIIKLNNFLGLKFLNKIKKLIILKVFLRNWKSLLFIS